MGSIPSFPPYEYPGFPGYSFLCRKLISATHFCIYAPQAAAVIRADGPWQRHSPTSRPAWSGTTHRQNDSPGCVIRRESAQIKGYFAQKSRGTIFQGSLHVCMPPPSSCSKMVSSSSAATWRKQLPVSLQSRTLIVFSFPAGVRQTSSKGRARNSDI